MKKIIIYFFLGFLIVSCSNSKKNAIKDTTEIIEEVVTTKEPEIVNNEETIADEIADIENTVTEEKVETEISNETTEVNTETVKKTSATKAEDVETNSKPTTKEAVEEEEAVKEIEPIIEEPKVSIDESLRTFVDKERGIDGNWSLKQEGENVYIVFHSNFKTKSGPDLKIFISKQDIGNANGKNAENNAILLNNLTSNKGEQKYLIPSNIDLSQYKSILIHCKKYAKLWGGGKL